MACPHCGTIVHKAAPSLADEIAAEKQFQAVIQLKMRLHSGGRLALAKVVSAQPTGILRQGINGKGMLINLTLEVEPQGAAPYTAQAGALVSLAGLDNFKPGVLLDVHYDPQDRTLVSVEGRHGVKNYPGEPDRNPQKE